MATKKPHRRSPAPKRAAGLKQPAKGLVVLAAAAHPDDIEFGMAGTLLLLGQAGAELHMWNLANGACGTEQLRPKEIARQRLQEARASARLAGATLHTPVCDDLAIFFDRPQLARVAAGIREIKPDVLLLPSPQDYMEDHQNACRLLVTAAFVRGMPNFPTKPSREPWQGELALYHAMPHGLQDGLRRLVRPGQYVDISGVLSQKRLMLAQHRSQKEWLDRSQGMDAYLKEMEAVGLKTGKLSGRFKAAEGWRRHSHLGFNRQGWDPLSTLLGPLCLVDKKFERSLLDPKD